MTDAQRLWEKRSAELERTSEYKAEEIAIDLAIQVEQELQTRHFNQKYLAEKMGVSKSYISQVLQGKTNMTILTLCKLADALNTSLQIKFSAPLLSMGGQGQLVLSVNEDSFFPTPVIGPKEKQRSAWSSSSFYAASVTCEEKKYESAGSI